MRPAKLDPCPCCALFTFTGSAESRNGRKVQAATQALLASQRLRKHPSPGLAEVVWHVAPQPSVVNSAVLHIPCPNNRAICRVCYDKGIFYVTTCGSAKGGSVSTIRRHFINHHPSVAIPSRKQLKEAVRERAAELSALPISQAAPTAGDIPATPPPASPAAHRSVAASSSSAVAGGSPARYLPHSPQYNALNEALSIFISSTCESSRELLSVRLVWGNFQAWC